jgi:lysophospholipase L1-like esterase
MKNKNIFLLLLILTILFCTSCNFNKYNEINVTLSANKYKDYIQLDSKILCNTIGAKKPYELSWISNDSRIILNSCQNKNTCNIKINDIGSYKINCFVKDKLQKNANSSVVLNVLKKPIKIDTIIALGDSLTNGYGNLEPEKNNWINYYSKNFKSAKLFNYAIAGAKSSDVLKNQLNKLNTDLNSIKKDSNKLIFLWIGANDVIRQTPISEFNNNYKEIIEYLKEIPNAQIILINIPDASKLPVITDFEDAINSLIIELGFSAKVQVKTLSKEQIFQYNLIIEGVAKNYNIPVIDMFSYLKYYDESLITKDQFHPNVKGHRVIEQKISTDVKLLFEKFRFY